MIKLIESTSGSSGRTSADLSALPYYQALALFKLAIILKGSVARWRAAGSATAPAGQALCPWAQGGERTSVR